jgi:hypothetical protein
VTRAETRATVSHTDDALTLEGNLVNWLDTDDLDVYDSWATIATALAQLWTDQGGAAFTASQYVRIFAGTWVERILPNAGLNGDVINGYLFVIEGDPDDDRDNVVIASAGSTQSILISTIPHVIIRHMKVAGNPTDSIIRGTNNMIILQDCTITGTRHGLRTDGVGIVEDCEFIMTADTRAVWIDNDITIQHAGVVRRCTITGPGSGASTLPAIRVTYGALHVEAVGISGFNKGVEDPTVSPLSLRNCTFHDCTYGLHFAKIASLVEIVNCAFDACTTVVLVPQWPEETAAHFGPEFVQLNNCYDGYTDFSEGPAAANKTYAQWAALNLVTSEGELDDLDPLTTDPANGDFSLPATSPCRRVGRGVGILTDYLGVDFDAFAPEIGAWSGTLSVATLTWPATLPQTVDQPTFTEGFADVVERSSMDSGPAKIRQRFTGGIQTFRATITLTTAQAATLQTFFDVTTAGGSLEFAWTHPRTGAVARMRFLAAPTLTQPGPQHFVAALALEVLA